MLRWGHPRQGEGGALRCLKHLGAFIIILFLSCLYLAHAEEVPVLSLRFDPLFPPGMDHIPNLQMLSLPGESFKTHTVKREPIRLERFIPFSELENYIDLYHQYLSRAEVFSENSSIQCIHLDRKETDPQILKYCQRVLSLTLVSNSLSYLLAAEADARLKFPYVPVYRACFAHSAIAEEVLRNEAGFLGEYNFPELVRIMEDLRTQFLKSKDKKKVSQGVLEFTYSGYTFNIHWHQRGRSNIRGSCYDEYVDTPEGIWPTSSIYFRSIPTSYEEFKKEVFNQLNEIYINRTFYKTIRDFGLDYIDDYKFNILPDHWDIKREYERLQYPGSKIHVPEGDEVRIQYHTYDIYYQTSGKEDLEQQKRIIADRIRELMAQIDQEFDVLIVELENKLALNYPDANEEEFRRIVEERLGSEIWKLRASYAQELVQRLQADEDLSIRVFSHAPENAEFVWSRADESLPEAILNAAMEFRRRQLRNLPERYLPSSTEFVTDENGEVFLRFSFITNFEIIQPAYEAFGGYTYINIKNDLAERFQNENFLKVINRLLQQGNFMLLPTDTYWEFALENPNVKSSEATKQIISNLNTSNVRTVINLASRILARRQQNDPEFNRAQSLY